MGVRVEGCVRGELRESYSRPSTVDPANGHVMHMRITYSSCKLLILSVRKLTKAYKVK